MREVAESLQIIGEWAEKNQRHISISCSKGFWTYSYDNTEEPYSFIYGHYFETYKEALENLCEKLSAK